MFSLIITLVSIVLVAGLALVGVYYLGDTVDTQQVEARTAQLLNETAQVNGALTLYSTDHPGVTVTDLNVLVTEGYLERVPNTAWSVSGDQVVRPVSTVEDCDAFNAKMGYTVSPPPSCSDPAWAGKIYCCQL